MTDKPGKRLQDIVRRIEFQLAPGCDVRSPDWIEDRTTGQEREVDVSIRSEVAGHELLIIEECRDHKRPVGIGYVEQVAKKREDLRANKAVIVSRAGVTKGARRKGEHENITLLSVTDALEFDWRLQVSPDAKLIQVKYSFSASRVVLRPNAPKPPDDVRARLEQFTELKRTDLQFYQIDGTPWGGIDKLSARALASVPQGYEWPKSREPMTLIATSVDGELFADVEDLGRLPFSTAAIIGEAWTETVEVPFEHLNLTDNAAGPHALYADAKFVVQSRNGDELDATLYAVADGGGLRLAVEFRK